MEPTLAQAEIDKINRIIAEVMDVAPEQITLEARFIEDFGADSLTIMELALALEEQFAITVPEEMLDQTSSVADLYEALARFGLR